MRVLLVVVATILLIAGCKSDSSSRLGDAMGSCSSKVEVVNSYGDTIRLKYNVSETILADQVASDWCKEKGKLYSKNTMNCSGCCTSTYLCQSENK